MNTTITSPSSSPTSAHDNASSSRNLWTSDSSNSNNITSLLDGAENPVEATQHKIKLRRSTRRRTLAPIDISQININVSANNLHDHDDDNADDNDNEDDNDNDDDDTKGDTASSSSTRKRIRYHSDSIETEDADALLKDDSRGFPKSAHVDLDVTPPKQRKHKKHQRRRSLAVQNGCLLLGPTSLSSQSSSAQTMSSLSDVSNSGLSTFSSVEVKPSEGGDGIAIISSRNNNDKEPPKKHDDPNLQFEEMANRDESMTNKTGNDSVGSSSTLSKICNGVATMMEPCNRSSTKDDPVKICNGVATMMEPCNRSSTKDDPVKICNGVATMMEPCNRSSTKDDPVKKKPRKRRQAAKKISQATPAPTRRSARIRKSISAAKITQDSPDVTTAKVAQDEQCPDVKNHTTKVEYEKPNIHLEDTETNTVNREVSKDQPQLNSIIKPKRRRRGSLGLHVGGLISLKDMEAMQKEANARKKQKNITRGLQPLQTVAVDSNTCSVEVQAKNGNFNGNVNATEDIPIEDKKVEINMDHSRNDANQRVVGEIVPSPCSLMCSNGESGPFQVSAEAIQAAMKDVFKGLEIDNKPCVTPRLFTCVILLLQHKGHTTEQVSPIIPLLRSFVSAEVASLKDLDTTKKIRRKKLNFCSFDFSSTINPTDTAVESNVIIESCISKLHGIIQEIDKLSAKTDCVQTIGAFVNALICIENESQTLSYAQCSKAMPFLWPVGRFRKASIQYREELSFIIAQIRSPNENSRISFVRSTLGDFIGRAIRFHLRRFFNPVPLPLHSDGDNLPDYSSSRSRIHGILEMKDADDGDRDTATADGSISAVVGIALQRMIQFFELNCEMMSRKDYASNGGYCKSFCKRPASVGGILERGCVIELEQEDIDEVLLDIKEGHTILAGVRACYFIKSLLTWPGVSDAISDVGGWGKVESLASLFQICDLAQEMPAEDHFILLSDINSLVKKIEHDNNMINDIEKQCEDSLRKLWKKFRCGTRNKELLLLNPCITVFQRELRKGGKKTKLPFIVEANPWE